MRFAHIGNRERPAHPMQRILAARLVLGAAKIGQHILEAPAGIAELPPMIEVRRLAADVEQAIDRARPAQHFPPWLDDLPVVELRLRLRAIEPIDLTIGEQLAVAERDVNPDVPVVAARLQQENAMATRGGQTIGENAAGAAGADDDVVEGLRMGLHRRVASRALNSRIPRARSQSVAPRDRKLPVNLPQPVAHCEAQFRLPERWAKLWSMRQASGPRSGGPGAETAGKATMARQVNTIAR